MGKKEETLVVMRTYSSSVLFRPSYYDHGSSRCTPRISDLFTWEGKLGLQIRGVGEEVEQDEGYETKKLT